MNKERIIKVIEDVYVDEKGYSSLRDRTALKLIKENINITYANHWYIVKIYDDIMRIYCNQKNTIHLERFARNKTALREAKRIIKQNFKNQEQQNLN